MFDYIFPCVSMTAWRSRKSMFCSLSLWLSICYQFIATTHPRNPLSASMVVAKTVPSFHLIICLPRLTTQCFNTLMHEYSSSLSFHYHDSRKSYQFIGGGSGSRNRGWVLISSFYLVCVRPGLLHPLGFAYYYYSSSSVHYHGSH